MDEVCGNEEVQKDILKAVQQQGVKGTTRFKFKKNQADNDCLMYTSDNITKICNYEV